MDDKYGIFKVPIENVNSYFEFLDHADNIEKLVQICWSYDISEELEHGDYLYQYIEIVPMEEYWLYMKSTHPWGIPDRIIKFTLNYQMHLEYDCDEIEIYPVNMDWFEAFLMIRSQCIQRLKDLLMKSDRPRLIDRIRRGGAVSKE